jgi:hypothetical protein
VAVVNQSAIGAASDRSSTMYRQKRMLAMSLLFLFSLTNPAGAATIGFKPAVNYPVGTAPRAVAPGDFNDDGKTDLAVANSGDAGGGDDGNVSILLGNGDGTFQAANNIAAGKNPVSVAVGDFNGDGRLDLVVANHGNNTVSVLLGNGNGTFQAHVDYATGTGPNSVAIGDFNGDGSLDLVVANAGSSASVSVILGNGDGTFQPHADYPIGVAANGVVIADLDSDRKMDLIASRFWGISILLGNGDGTFQTGMGFLVAFFTGHPVAADFNQDGKPDVVVVAAGFGEAARVFLLPGNGDGTFQNQIDVGFADAVVVADFNGDNKPDLVGALLEAGTVSLWLGNGDGTFQAPSSFATGSRPGSPMAADLNHDKVPDLVVTNSDNNTISVLLNTAGTDFSISASTPTPGTVSRGQSATSTVTLKLLNAFDNPITLTCSVQPLQSAPACSINPSSVTFDANGNATATLTINTSAATAALAPSSVRHNTRPLRYLWLPVAGFALLGTGLGSGRSSRQRLTVYLLGSILFGGLIFQTACGGGSGGPGSTTYTITITGTSGSTQHSTTTALTVQ